MADSAASEQGRVGQGDWKVEREDPARANLGCRFDYAIRGHQIDGAQFVGVSEYAPRRALAATVLGYRARKGRNS